MNYTTAVFLINEAVRGVMAAYELDHDGKAIPGKTHLLKTVDRTLKVGDLVIVPTETRVKFTVCKVTEVDVEPDFESTLPVKWIVGKVDTAGYDRLISQENEAIDLIKAAEKKKQRDDLRAKVVALQEEKIALLEITHAGAETAPAV